ncbi:MAG: DEAD/DEAH box helicase [Proteobacteria bacterium]|nr:DEAD/DEAH box helicase [Cystobacterineae bacterium]MCL2258269.1 DEAD/DEAH box helicase [Cystobacterineae bacterium]MCL2315386.1 DEAD/DEAH box helicase [Pseudomonadota bacterium]
MYEQQQRAKSSRDERGGGRGNSRGGKRFGEGKTDTGARKVIVELGNLERALTKGDFSLEQSPLQEILRTLRSMRLSSLEQLEPNARGRLITSLFRVMRQKKPVVWDEFLRQATAAVSASAEQAPARDKPSEEAAAVGSELSQEVLAAPKEVADEPELPRESAVVVEASSSVEVAVFAAEEKQAGALVSPEQLQAQAYRSVLDLVGRIWRALGEQARSQAVLEASGLRALSEEPQLLPEPAKRAPDSSHKEKFQKDKKREKSSRIDSRVTFKDWREQAAHLEQARRTRDAGRLHEKNASFVEAVRLFELGGDLKSALRCAVLGEIEEASTRLMSRLSSSEVKSILERLAAWGLLMAYCAKTKDYEAVARLYERARQMDQAALAWEKVGRLSLARKAYEQAGDLESASRMRAIEVQQLMDRGDRLGAATLLVATGNTQAAIDALKELPGPKAYRFLLKLKLEEEAQKLATTQIDQAIATGDHPAHARWLEALDKLPEAIEAWLKADRRDKAMYLFEKTDKHEQAAELAEALGRLDKAEALFRRAGNEEQAARIAALPRPVVAEARQDSSLEPQASDVM